MKISVLGSSGSEGLGQNPPGFLVDDFLLLDAGTVALALDTEAQCKITHIFLTHAHLDHIKAIPFLVDNIVAANHESSLLILSSSEAIADLRRNIFNNRIWPDFTQFPTPDRPVMRYQAISTSETFDIRGYRIRPIRVDHARVPAYGYMIENSNGNTVIYTGDTGPTERIWRHMNGRRISCLIIEVSFPNEMTALALTSGHLTPALLSKEIEKMPVLPERILITHLKPYYKQSIETQLAALRDTRIEVLSDGDLIHI